MLSTSRDVRRIDSQITADNYTFGTVKEFTYLGSPINTKNDVRLEIKSRFTLANRCYYGLNGQLSNKDFSYDKTNTLLDAHPICASLWCRGMDPIKH